MIEKEGNYIALLAKTLRPFDTLKDLPIPKFVELVETNPDVTSTFASHPRPHDSSKSSELVEESNG